MSLDVSLMIGETEYFEANITHNLGEMASAAGLYRVMWRPEELFDENPIKAKSLIPHLEKGIKELESPERKAQFLEYNPENGWGSFDGLMKTAKAYLKACEDLPHADVWISR